MFRSSDPEVFLGDFLKKCSKFTGEHPCRSVILIKLLCNFIEIALRHGCSLVNLLHISRTLFLTNTSGRLLLNVLIWYIFKFLCCYITIIFLGYGIFFIPKNLFHLRYWTIYQLFTANTASHIIKANRLVYIANRNTDFTKCAKIIKVLQLLLTPRLIKHV